MPSRLTRQPGIHCPTNNLLYAYRYETLRFNYFTKTSPDLKKRDEAGTLINIYKQRLFDEFGIDVNNKDGK